MKIIFAPAKTFDLTNELNEDFKVCDISGKIIKTLQAMHDEELKSVMKVSDKMFKVNKTYINDFSKRKSFYAVEMYNGVAYKSLDVRSMSKYEIEYLQEHLYILSALYGVIKPLDLIKPYRLDFNSSLKVEDKSLKKLWKEYYNEQIRESEVVFNLASNEFSSLFIKERYEWYDFEFFEVRNEKKKSNSTIAKKGRGRLLRELAFNQITDIECVKKINGYGSYFEVV